MMRNGCSGSSLSLIFILFFFDVISLTGKANGAQKFETIIPVRLLDSSFQEDLDFPPRYAVGSLGIPSVFRNLFTFDLGNPRETILDVSMCLGCEVKVNNESIGCPSSVPMCNVSSTSCWVSDPDQPLPSWSFSFTLDPCANLSTSTGNIDIEEKDIPTCIQCFDSGNHSRFYAYANPSLPFWFLHHDSSKKVAQIPPSFRFGALVRTVPNIDRIWSNIGLGYNSSFLTQTETTRFMLRFSNRQKASVILHPEYKHFIDSAFIEFEVSRHRIFTLQSFEFGDNTLLNNATFFMDTGNDGISIADSMLKHQLSEVSGGIWLPHQENDRNNYGTERLYIPRNSTNNLIFSSLKVSFQKCSKDKFVPVPNWLILGVKNENQSDLIPTIFETYHKNVLGLPFLSSPNFDFIFDDTKLRLYLVSSHAKKVFIPEFDLKAQTS